eukprot:12626284-Alexandrium_andersonii.AAC.1
MCVKRLSGDAGGCIRGMRVLGNPAPAESSGLRPIPPPWWGGTRRRSAKGCAAWRLAWMSASGRWPVNSRAKWRAQPLCD